LTNVKNESRLFKEAFSLIEHDVVSEILVLGLHDEGPKKEENLSDKIKLVRVALKTRKLPKNLFFQLLKYLEFVVLVLLKYHDKKRKW